jgi:hypothetical protein
MRAPALLDRLSIDEKYERFTPSAPLGFWPNYDFALGLSRPSMTNRELSHFFHQLIRFWRRCRLKKTVSKWLIVILTATRWGQKRNGDYDLLCKAFDE